MCELDANIQHANVKPGTSSWNQTVIQVLVERKELALSWEEEQANAQIKVRWQQTSAICPSLDEEEEVIDMGFKQVTH